MAKYPLRIESSLPGVTAIRTGAIQVHAKLSNEDLRKLCDDDEQARLLDEMGMRNVLAVPLVARGKTLGSISLVRSSPLRVWTPTEIELAKELAHRAALAVENARLHRETQEAVRLRDEFLAVASHELNTPMTSLVLTLQALAQNEIGLTPERRRELTKVAERQSSRLTRLVRELLDVTRLERKRIELTPEEVDLEDLLREGVARCAPELEKARCTVSIVASGRVVGEWDRSRLDQVVSNLLANAIKFGAGKPIDIVLGVRDERAYFEITDHGIGIEETAQARIFERFERAVPVRHYGGLGLGLYICRHIVEAHGGAIRVRSAPGQGATFIVELPRVANAGHDSSGT